VRSRVFTCKHLIDLGKISCQITSVTCSMQLNHYNKLLYAKIMQIKCTKGIWGWVTISSLSWLMINTRWTSQSILSRHSIKLGQLTLDQLADIWQSVTRLICVDWHLIIDISVKNEQLTAETLIEYWPSINGNVNGVLIEIKGIDNSWPWMPLVHIIWKCYYPVDQNLIVRLT